MIYEKEIKLLVNKTKKKEKLEQELALKELRSKALALKKDKKSFLKQKWQDSKEKVLDKKYFSKLKKDNLNHNEEEIFSLEKDNILFKVIYNKFLQKQVTVSDFNHCDTSYIKFDIFLSIEKNNIKDMQFLEKNFVEEREARNYFSELKEKIVKTNADILLHDILLMLNNEIKNLQKELKK